MKLCKKYCMLIFTFLIGILTVVAFLLEVKVSNKLNYKMPGISIVTEKYGEITNMVWAPNDDKSIIFLSARHSTKHSKDASADVAYLYKADIESGKVEELCQFSPHKNIKQFLRIVFKWNNGDVIITPYDKGVYEISLKKDSAPIINQVEVPNFSKAETFDVGTRYYFTTKEGKFINIYEPNNYNSFVMFNNINESNSNRLKTYFMPTYKIMDEGDNVWFYSIERGRNGFNAYLVEENNGHVGFKSKLIKKNVINAKSSPFGQKLVAFIDNENKYDVYSGRFSVKPIIDSIPKNTDLLGQIPDITIHGEKAIYTKFDEKHMGTIMSEVSGEILKDIPIVGPLSLNASSAKDGNILFYTYENKEIKVKIYSINEKKLKDITTIFK